MDDSKARPETSENQEGSLEDRVMMIQSFHINSRSVKDSDLRSDKRGRLAEES